MPWSVQMASIEPVALAPMGRWSLESTTTTVITGHRIATGESIVLLVYTALVALVLMGQQSSVGLTKAEADLMLTSLDPGKAGPTDLGRRHGRARDGGLARTVP